MKGYLNYITYSIIGLLVIILILVIILFLKLYFKIKSADKNSINLVEFPKETNQKISNFITDTQAQNKELKDFLINEHKDAKKIITEVDEKIAPFEKVAREKNDELKLYKSGYEYSRNKAIIDGIIETIEFIENAEKKINISDEVLKSYFSTSKEKLIIILNNSGIESYEPKINTPSLDDYGCEVDINTEKTNDEKKNNLIFSVLRKGYKINLSESDIKYVKKALVKVYQFEKKEDTIKH